MVCRARTRTIGHRRMTPEPENLLRAAVDGRRRKYDSCRTDDPLVATVPRARYRSYRTHP